MFLHQTPQFYYHSGVQVECKSFNSHPPSSENFHILGFCVRRIKDANDLSKSFHFLEFPFGVDHGFPPTYAVLSYLKLIAVQYFKVSSHGANLKCFGCLNHTWKTSSSAYPSSKEQLNILRRLTRGPA